jgi:5-hydroxyisourate hydrolase
MSPITTHVLDLSSGSPARGIAVTLSALRDHGRWDDLAHGLTDHNGRVSNLLPDGSPMSIGTYRIEFKTHDYFIEKKMTSFYPSVVVSFLVDDPLAHYHVPLLLSPFGYSTYRGS